MKIRVYLLIMLLFTSFSSSVYAAKKVHNLFDIKISVDGKVGKPYNKKQFPKRNAANLRVKLFQKNNKLQNRKHNNIIKIIDKPVLTVVSNKDTGQIDNKIVKFDFKDEIAALSKHHDDGKNVILQITKKDDVDGKKHHDGGLGNSGGDHPVNPVPIPAALWLFAPTLLGLLGLRRKQPEKN